MQDCWELASIPSKAGWRSWYTPGRMKMAKQKLIWMKANNSVFHVHSTQCLYTILHLLFFNETYLFYHFTLFTPLSMLLFSLDSFLNKLNHVVPPSSFLPTSFWWEPTFLTEKETSPGRCCQDNCVSIGGCGGTMATWDLSPLRFIKCWGR